MDETSTKSGRADPAPLGFVDDEVGVGCGPVTALQQFRLQREEPIGHLMLEGHHRGRESLASRGEAMGLEQAGPTAKGGIRRRGKGGIRWHRNWSCFHVCSICWPG